jgi:hypothetical protein
MLQISKLRSDFSFNKAGRLAEAVLLLTIAGLIALGTFQGGSKAGLVIAVGSIGLTLLFLCLYHVEAGVYAMLIFAFVIAFIERMIPMDFSLVSVLMALPFVLFTILLIKSIFERRHKLIAGHPVIFIYMVTVGYVIAQTFNPGMDSFLGWLSYFRGVLIFLAILFVFLYIFRNFHGVRFFFKFIFTTLFITGLYGCIQHRFGFTSFETRWIYTNPNVLQLYSLPGAGLRTFSFLSDPANFGTLMSTGALGTIIFALGPFSKMKRIILGFFSLVMVVGMSYSGTRTADITLVGGLALYILMTINEKRSRILAFCAAAGMMLLIFLPIYGNVTINRMRSAFQVPSGDASYDVRNIHRHEMQPFLHTHPFGNGVNTTMGAGNKYNPHNFLAGFPPDSSYFQIALEQGWVGLLLNCIFYFTILFYAVHYFYKCRNREIKVYYGALTVMLFSMMLGAYTQFTISSIPQNFVFMALVAGVIKLHIFDQPVLNKINS